MKGEIYMFVKPKDTKKMGEQGYLLYRYYYQYPSLYGDLIS